MTNIGASNYHCCAQTFIPVLSSCFVRLGRSGAVVGGIYIAVRGKIKYTEKGRNILASDCEVAWPCAHITSCLFGPVATAARTLSSGQGASVAL